LIKSEGEILMEKDLGIICGDGLSFFGTTNRLISHELKNILAIISETLGLIDELIELSDTGLKLEPGKLRSLSKSILEEIDRANSLVKNMNTFAHNVDEFIDEVDVNQAIDLIIKISRLNSSSRNTEILFNEKDQVILKTSPFFLSSLLHHAIDFAILCTGPKKKIAISIVPGADEVKIVISGLADIKGAFTTPKAMALAKAISAKISLETKSGELYIELPKKIEEDLIKNLS
jgi:light-regulated signal transduction histidine kinase (bacteriophytochrome)